MLGARREAPIIKRVKTASVRGRRNNDGGIPWEGYLEKEKSVNKFNKG